MISIAVVVLLGATVINLSHAQTTTTMQPPTSLIPNATTTTANGTTTPSSNAPSTATNGTRAPNSNSTTTNTNGTKPNSTTPQPLSPPPPSPPSSGGENTGNSSVGGGGLYEVVFQTAPWFTALQVERILRGFGDINVSNPNSSVVKCIAFNGPKNGSVISCTFTKYSVARAYYFYARVPSMYEDMKYRKETGMLPVLLTANTLRVIEPGTDENPADYEFTSPDLIDLPIELALIVGFGTGVVTGLLFGVLLGCCCCHPGTARKWQDVAGLVEKESHAYHFNGGVL
eukprot:PhF_6_TR26222/c0_g1_i1/m.37394